MTDGVPPTLEAALAERSDLDLWLQQFTALQQEHPGRLLRLAFLNGWIEARSALPSLDGPAT